MRRAGLAEDCQDTLSRHGRSFRWAQVFLSKQQRLDSALAYAFCREADDSVDEANGPSQARAQLDELRAMLEGERPATPLVSAFLELSARTGFGLGPARALLLAMESDLATVRMAEGGDLGTYCYRAAGTVGLMMCGILGVRSQSARQRAVDLGVAMQLTNVCRDVREDAERGRVYLPADLLAYHGLEADDLLSGRLEGSSVLRRRLAAATRDVLALAELGYESGRAGYAHLPWRARLAVAVAAELYRGIGHHLEHARGADPWRGRVRVPVPLKCWLVVKALGVWLRPSSWFVTAAVETLGPPDSRLSP